MGIGQLVYCGYFHSIKKSNHVQNSKKGKTYGANNNVSYQP
jgi:hypothetical protein